MEAGLLRIYTRDKQRKERKGKGNKNKKNRIIRADEVL